MFLKSVKLEFFRIALFHWEINVVSRPNLTLYRSMLSTFIVEIFRFNKHGVFRLNIMKVLSCFRRYPATLVSRRGSNQVLCESEKNRVSLSSMFESSLLILMRWDHKLKRNILFVYRQFSYYES